MQIIESLILKDDWITIQQLSDAIGASQRTMTADIATLKKRWASYLNIEVSVKQGVRIHNCSIAMMGSVFLDIFNESLALRWLKELLYHPRKPLEYYEERLFTSRSTLNRLLPRINGALSPRGMTVCRRGNNYEIHADDEQYLRQFFASFLIELGGIPPKDCQPDIDMQLLAGTVKKILEAPGCHLLREDDIGTMFLSVFYLVSLIRENQGYTIASDYSIAAQMDDETFGRLSVYFSAVTRQNLCAIHEFIARKQNGWDDDDEQSRVQSAAQVFLDQTFQTLGLSPGKQVLHKLRNVITMMYLTAKFRPGATSVLFDRVYYFSLLFQMHNRPVYALIEENLAQFSRDVGLDMGCCIQDILLWICLTWPPFHGCLLPKKVLVVSDFGRQHSAFLAQMLTGFFNHDDGVAIQPTVASYPDVLEEASRDVYDIIVTTVPNLPISHPHIILVNDYPSHENLCAVYRALRQQDET